MEFTLFIANKRKYNYLFVFFNLEKKTSTKQEEITNNAPKISLTLIISFANKAALAIPTTTSKAKSILSLPGSKISTLKKVNRIEGSSHNNENKIIHIYKEFNVIRIFEVAKLLPPGTRQNNKKINAIKTEVKEVFSIPVEESAI